MITKGYPFIILFSLFSLALSSDSTYNNFLRCLKDQTTSSPSSNVYSKEHTRYTSVLDAYVRNLRFAYPTSPKPQLIITPFNPTQVSASVVCAQISASTSKSEVEATITRAYPTFLKTTSSSYVEAGCTLGELYYKIQEKSNTLGFPAGVCPTVGVGGHFSGGGYGNMIIKYGLSVDHIIDSTVVDAEGRILNRSSMGEDLFWAIQGGGGASFAVVVSFTLKLVPVPKTVTVFNIKRFDNITDLVYTYQFLMKDIDHNLFIRLLLQPVSDPIHKGNRTSRVTFIALYLGDANTLLSLLNNSFPELGVTKGDCLEMRWGESVLNWANFDNKTSMNVLLNRSYTADYLKRKSDYVQTPIPKQG